jgi:serine/threonine protein kinase
MGVYQAPEAMNAKPLTQKSDVYSFGVVLLELLTGRSPFLQLAAGDLDLVSWMRAALQQKKALSQIIDPCLLKGSNNEQSKMIETLQVSCKSCNSGTYQLVLFPNYLEPQIYVSPSFSSVLECHSFGAMRKRHNF